jgi:3-hydroxyisobutyrate dehydrogenase-like beta-hydroxyacid dehydrogenase
MKLVLDVIGKGAAQSWQMDNRGKTMVDGKFDFGFAVDWMRKDLGLVLDEARATARAAGDGAGRPVLRRRAGHGRRRWDTSSLIKRSK